MSITDQQKKCTHDSTSYYPDADLVTCKDCGLAGYGIDWPYGGLTEYNAIEELNARNQPELGYCRYCGYHLQWCSEICGNAGCSNVSCENCGLNFYLDTQAMMKNQPWKI